MDAFRAAFLLTAAYANTMTEEQLMESLFSFPHLDRKEGQLPSDKITSLMDGLEGVEVNKRPEEFANLVYQAVSGGLGIEGEIRGGPTDLTYLPFVDEFVSKFTGRWVVQSYYCESTPKNQRIRT
jgi:hypothetical protein